LCLSYHYIFYFCVITKEVFTLLLSPIFTFCVVAPIFVFCAIVKDVFAILLLHFFVFFLHLLKLSQHKGMRFLSFCFFHIFIFVFVFHMF